MSGQMSLFDIGDNDNPIGQALVLPPVGEFDKKEYLAYEKEVTGIYLSGHPLNEYSDMIRNLTDTTCGEFMRDDNDEITLMADSEATIAGIITRVSQTYTKKTVSLWRSLRWKISREVSMLWYSQKLCFVQADPCGR